MTFNEAKQKWNVSYETLCSWLDLGYIPKVNITDGKIQIGSIKPMVPKANSDITVENVRKYILKACNELNYIDYKILQIEAEQFKSIMKQLEENDYIRKNIPNASLTSNENFTITTGGEEFLKKGKFKMNYLGFNFKFKYLKIKAKFERK